MTTVEASPLRAAEYMRMSTEHQQYSIANQAAAIEEYAHRHSIEIVRTYVDRGKSGLGLAGRHGLKELLGTVASGLADFSVLLVYDVSRWGRFQDVDESAYHEHGLKRAGVSVIYCAESFRGNGGPMDALLKTLKRTMAAEYSRELSAKVFEGQLRVAGLGYRVGGAAGFGFRRMLIDPSGSRRTVLETGEHKTIQTDRVTLVHGPIDEVQTVRKVFDLFVGGNLSEARIAAYLTEAGIMTRFGNRWRKKTIRDMLTNPKYAGDMVFNRTAGKMLSPLVKNPQEQWVCVPDRIEGIVSREIFNQAQAIFAGRIQGGHEEDMLTSLRALLAKHGRLSSVLIDSEPGMLNAVTYQKRFGSLLEAYRRIGWDGERQYRYVTLRIGLRGLQTQLDKAITATLTETADSFCKDPDASRWTVNGELSIYATVVFPRTGERRRWAWTLRASRKRTADLLVLARSNPEANRILDYFVFPGGGAGPIRVFDENPGSIELHRFTDLTFLKIVCRRSSLEEV